MNSQERILLLASVHFPMLYQPTTISSTGHEDSLFQAASEKFTVSSGVFVDCIGYNRHIFI